MLTVLRDSTSTDGSVTTTKRAFRVEWRFLLSILAALPVWAALSFVNGPRLPSAFTRVWLETYLIVTLAYPIVEELTFRGLLQGWLRRFTRFRRDWRGLTLANLATTIPFVAAHFLYHPPAWSIAVAIPSLIFGYFRDRYGRIGPCIVLHIWYNAGYYLLFGNAT